MRRSATLALVLGATVGCASSPGAPHSSPPRPTSSPAAPPAPARTASLDQLLRDQMAPFRAIPWSPERRLRWSHFQGTPPGGGREGALTSYSLFYAWKCLGPAFEFRVVAGFQPGQSWVKAEILRDSAQNRRALRHEQAHFDIAEVHARRMRRYFANLAGACTHSDDDLGGMAQRFVDDARAMQRQYDGETEHGLRAERQAAWEAQVARLLAPPR
jgi:Bacterial protein of unknown function (DUF922)